LYRLIFDCRLSIADLNGRASQGFQSEIENRQSEITSDNLHTIRICNGAIASKELIL